MQEFWQALTTHPMTPWFGWLALGTLAIFWGLGQVRPHSHEDPVEKLQKSLGMESVSGWLLTIAVFLWVAIFGVLFLGLISLLADIVWSVVQPETREEKADFRFMLTKTTALTAVLAAVIAVPFTIVRIKLTAEQNRHAQDVLYNEKLNEAVESLHARYQVTESEKDVWKDDIIKRNGAIDRLEALAIEQPAQAPRISRMLCVYLRELTRDYPALKPPKSNRLEDQLAWEQDLTVQRSDMETAAQVLGRLHKKTGVAPEDLGIDLSDVNLQAMKLSSLSFQKARFNDAALDGADLMFTELGKAKLYSAGLNRTKLIRTNLSSSELGFAEFKGTWLISANLENANFEHAAFGEGTIFTNANLLGAVFRNVDLSKTKNIGDQIRVAFGDATVRLPNAIGFPSNWPDKALGYPEFEDECNLFRKNPSSYIPPQHRNS